MSARVAVLLPRDLLSYFVTRWRWATEASLCRGSSEEKKRRLMEGGGDVDGGMGCVEGQIKKHLYNVMGPEGSILCVKGGSRGHIYMLKKNAVHPQPAPKYPHPPLLLLFLLLLILLPPYSALHASSPLLPFFSGMTGRNFLLWSAEGGGKRALFTLHLAAVDNRPSLPLTPRAVLHSLLLPPSPAPFRKEAPGAGSALHLDLSRRHCLVFLFCFVLFS